MQLRYLVRHTVCNVAASGGATVGAHDDTAVKSDRHDRGLEGRVQVEMCASLTLLGMHVLRYRRPSRLGRRQRSGGPFFGKGGGIRRASDEVLMMGGDGVGQQLFLFSSLPSP